MFDARGGPRLFGLPPGPDFAAALAEGLMARLAGEPPEAMARVEIFLNSARMRRRLSDALTTDGARLLPRMRILADLGRDAAALVPPAVPGLRRRLELTRLVARLLDHAPDLAPRAAIYDLADSLAGLMDEMQGEGVAPAALAALDLTDHSRHWERSLRFLNIVTEAFGPDAAPDDEARRRRVVETLIERWRMSPPAHPVIVAGSTGSRGTTALLMRAVAGLPQGALVLPGFDFDMPQAVWDSLNDAMAAEDHPQYRFRRLVRDLDLNESAVRPWSDHAPRHAARNRLISLALRPAPVTDQWMVDGPRLGDLAEAAAGLTLIEAASPRDEALAIALRLRHAVEEGQGAALISADRGLTRRVTAALDRWAIRPDDSAGEPLAQSAPGRLLRHLAALFGQKLTAESLMVLLKHPLTASTTGKRGPHLLWTHELELELRRNGPAFPTGAALIDWADRTRPDGRRTWAVWLGGLLDGLDTIGPRDLSAHVAHHLRLAEALAAGPDAAPDTETQGPGIEGGASGALWEREAGSSARSAMEELRREAPAGGVLGPSDYADLLTAHLQRSEVREAITADPRVLILGPREAREQGARLVILGGLNDGIWPALPAPDPWLNRQMRQKAGLLLPERQVGLAAHDFQQAVAAPEVVLSRALRDAEAETVPSRWLNRLTNLMQGLPEQGGPEALAAMRARGAGWLALARTLDLPRVRRPAAPRPAPRPPLAARPNELFVTGIRTLIRDPYAIYARHILRLRPLDPLRPKPDARLRGSALHRIFERFVQDRTPEKLAEARARLLATTDEVLVRDIPWTAARRLWRARLARAADWFLIRELAREGTPVLAEMNGKLYLNRVDFTLGARPDRIDLLPDGRLHIIDYKTGAPPTPKQQTLFDKQLLLEAAMAEAGAFTALGPVEVARITYIGLGSTPKEVMTEITPDLTARIRADLETLIAAYRDSAQGYAARRAVFEDRFEGDYDHLARYGEWDMSDRAIPEDVT